MNSPELDPGLRSIEHSESIGRLEKAFAEEMEQSGLRATVLDSRSASLPGGVRSLTLIEGGSPPTEQTVRLYRGLNTDEGASIAHQVCSLLKKPVSGEHGGYRRAELESQEAFAAVEVFVQDPTYENMIAMADSTSMYRGDRRFVNDRIDRIQLDMLRSDTTTIADEISSNHVFAPAGSTSQDLSPFLASATTAEQAASFGRTLMIVDVPVSHIASSGEGTSAGDGSGVEVLVAGGFRPEWITAVAQFEPGLDNRADAAAVIASMVDSSEQVTPDASSLRATAFHQKSLENRARDIVAINRDRTDMLLWSFGQDEKELSDQLVARGTTTYKEALHYCAEYYTQKRSELYGRRFSLTFDRDETDEPQFQTDSRGFFIKENLLDADRVRRLAERYHWEQQQQPK